MRLDEHSGKPVEKPIRLTNWSGYCMEDLSVTADGKRVAFVGSTVRNSVYLADLAAGGTTILKSRELTPDISGGNPMDWTADSKAIIFFSAATSHNEHDAVYRQRLDEDTSRLIVTAPGGFNDARVSSDGRWVLWFIEPEPGRPSVPFQLMRVLLTGGLPELVFTARRGSVISCARAPSQLCVIAERTEDRKRVIVTSFDPINGRGAELVRYSIDPSDLWNSSRVSPDGSRFAAIVGLDDPIQVFSLRGQSVQAIPTAELHNKQFLSWASDGKGFFITNGIKGGSELAHVDLHGNATVLWKNLGGYYPWGLQSPDGRYLAIQGSSTNGNMWTMENF
jgi:eukaryotic-like serine/threonine-protein kinase